MANNIESLSKSIFDRMPEDLRQYLVEQKDLLNFKVYEREPAKRRHRDDYSLCKSGTGDESWCSNMAEGSGSIYVSVDYPRAPEDSFRQILADCQAVLEQVRQLCMGLWKAQWGTDPTRIILSGSSFGGTLAILVTAIAVLNQESVAGLMTLVALTDTKPDLANRPWGDNEGTIGLTSERLRGDLQTMFERKHPDERGVWHSNPCKIPDEVLAMFPPTLDILYQSGRRFKARLEAQGVNVNCIEVDGLHQVKDMGRSTAAGREVEQFMLKMSKGFIPDNCAVEGPITGRLN